MRNERRQRKHVCSVLVLSIILVCQLSIVSCNESSVETYPAYTGDNWDPCIDEYDKKWDNCIVETDKTIGDIPGEIEYIEIESEGALYALGNIMAPETTKEYYLGSDYDINRDLGNFVFPQDIIEVEDKIDYLANANYKLTKDLTLTMQMINGTSLFLGIGSSDYPFKGVFNGNDKTVTLMSEGNISLDENLNHSVGLFGEIENAQILNTNVKVINDVVVDKCVDIIKFGSLAGSANNSIISDCHTMISNAKMGVDFRKNETKVDQAYVGGLVGEGTYSTIQNSEVSLTDSSVYANGYDVVNSAVYANFSVGGILGVSAPGSDNVVDIGKIGNKILNCKLSSSNSEKKDIIYASIETGGEVDVGGIIGFAFNNFVAKKCSVRITNGNVKAEKRGTADDTVSGTNAGGVIGRLEHTGELYYCGVSGNNMDIISRSPENLCSAGGIVGWDVGPYHRDVVSINTCRLDGGGTSKIVLDILDNTSKEMWNGLGGIAGVSAYRIENCIVENIILENRSENVKNCFAGEVCGVFNNVSGLWSKNEYFTPRLSDIIDCSTKKVNFDTTDNVMTSSVYGATY